MHEIFVAVQSVQRYALRYTNNEDRSQIKIVHTSPNQSGRLRHTPHTRKSSWFMSSKRSLLSGQASEQLGLIEIIHEVTNELDKYPELRKTTGTLLGTYSINIDPTVTPVEHGPRRQPKHCQRRYV